MHPQRAENRAGLETKRNLEAVEEVPRIVVRAGGSNVSPGLRDAWKQRELLFFLTLRDLKLRYKQTGVGLAWTVIQPLITAGVFSLIFGRFAGVHSEGAPYPLFCFAGLLVWNYFATTLGRGVTSLVANGFLLSRIYVPRILVPLSALLPGLVDIGVGLVVWGIAAVYYGVLPGVSALWLVPVAMSILLMFVMGLSLALGAMNVRFRDVANLLPFAIQVWMFLSPVIYPQSMVPPKWAFLLRWNPIVGIVGAFRSGLLNLPWDGRSLASAAILSTLTLGCGAVVFFRFEKSFADTL